MRLAIFGRTIFFLFAAARYTQAASGITKEECGEKINRKHTNTHKQRTVHWLWEVRVCAFVARSFFLLLSFSVLGFYLPLRMPCCELYELSCTINKRSGVCAHLRLLLALVSDAHSSEVGDSSFVCTELILYDDRISSIDLYLPQLISKYIRCIRHTRWNLCVQLVTTTMSRCWSMGFDLLAGIDCLKNLIDWVQPKPISEWFLSRSCSDREYRVICRLSLVRHHIYETKIFLVNTVNDHDWRNPYNFIAKMH